MQVYSYKNNNIVKEKSLINALDIDLNKDKVITVVGAGGKTSTIFELGNELSNLNKKTIITTTTHMKLDKDFLLIDEDFNIENLKKILQKNNLIKIGKKESDYKVKRLDEDTLKRCIDISDFLLIEGDGSKRLPLKAPKDNEPVIIQETDLVIGLIGFDSLDKKIEETCHRPELVSKLLHKNIKENINIFDLVEIIKNKNGLKKNVNCKYKVIINKVDKLEYLDKCKKIAQLCLEFKIDVIFTSYKI
jgi:probable selenium-dependent hydroxylase accessory protein YqeC|nr:selenium cofactor biosynthesis protein YqeC [uncultured Intestinibacter sp.]